MERTKNHRCFLWHFAKEGIPNALILWYTEKNGKREGVCMVVSVRSLGLQGIRGYEVSVEFDAMRRKENPETSAQVKVRVDAATTAFCGWPARSPIWRARSRSPLPIWRRRSSTGIRIFSRDKQINNRECRRTPGFAVFDYFLPRIKAFMRFSWSRMRLRMRRVLGVTSSSSSSARNSRHCSRLI